MRRIPHFRLVTFWPRDNFVLNKIQRFVTYVAFDCSANPLPDRTTAQYLWSFVCVHGLIPDTHCVHLRCDKSLYKQGSMCVGLCARIKSPNKHINSIRVSYISVGLRCRRKHAGVVFHTFTKTNTKLPHTTNRHGQHVKKEPNVCITM